MLSSYPGWGRGRESPASPGQRGPPAGPGPAIALGGETVPGHSHFSGEKIETGEKGLLSSRPRPSAKNSTETNEAKEPESSPWGGGGGPQLGTRGDAAATDLKALDLAWAPDRSLPRPPACVGTSLLPAEAGDPAQTLPAISRPAGQKNGRGSRLAGPARPGRVPSLRLSLSACKMEKLSPTEGSLQFP